MNSFIPKLAAGLAINSLLLTTLMAASRNAVAAAGESSGGIPQAIIPVDMDLECQAEYVISESSAGKDIFGKFLSKPLFLRSKANEVIPGSPTLNFGLSQTEWTLESETAENPDEEVFARYPKNVWFQIEFNVFQDYSKDDHVDVSVTMDLNESAKLSTQSMARATDEIFKAKVMYKKYEEQLFVATGASVVCKKTAPLPISVPPNDSGEDSLP